MNFVIKLWYLNQRRVVSTLIFMLKRVQLPIHHDHKALNKCIHCRKLTSVVIHGSSTFDTFVSQISTRVVHSAYMTIVFIVIIKEIACVLSLTRTFALLCFNCFLPQHEKWRNIFTLFWYGIIYLFSLYTVICIYLFIYLFIYLIPGA